MLACFLEIDCRIQPEKRLEFTQSAESLTPAAGEGFVRTIIYQDRDEPDHILWVEEWSARESLDRYLLSEDFAALLGGLRILGTVLDCRIIHSASIHPESGSPQGKSWFAREISTL